MRFSCFFAFSLSYILCPLLTIPFVKIWLHHEDSAYIYLLSEAFCGINSTIYQTLNLFVHISQLSCSGAGGGKVWRKYKKTLTSSGQWTLSWHNVGFLAYPRQGQGGALCSRWWGYRKMDFLCVESWLVTQLVFLIAYCLHSAKSLPWSFSNLNVLYFMLYTHTQTHSHTIIISIYGSHYTFFVSVSGFLGKSVNSSKVSGIQKNLIKGNCLNQLKELKVEARSREVSEKMIARLKIEFYARRYGTIY